MSERDEQQPADERAEHTHDEEAHELETGGIWARWVIEDPPSGQRPPDVQAIKARLRRALREREERT